MLTAALLALGLLAVIFAINAGLRVRAKRAAKRQTVIELGSNSTSPEISSDRVENASSTTEPGAEAQPILHEPSDPIEELGVDSGFM